MKILLLFLLVIPIFADDVKPSEKSSIIIQADLFSGDQDEIAEPVKTKFYLLKSSLVTILKKAKFTPEDENGKAATSDEDFLTAAGKALTGDDENFGVMSVLVTDLISKNKTLEIKTDEFGRASSSIETGNYYLFGVTKTDGETFVWHLLVQVNPGKNIVEVDQHNAELVFDNE